LKNAKELVDDFEGRIEAEIRCQEKVVEKKREKKEYRRMELPGKYTAKVLYEWDNKKFVDEYLKKLEKNWRRWKNNRQIDENEHLKNIEEKMEEKKKKIWNRDWKTGHFSRGEILKGSNVKTIGSGLCFFLFSFSFLFYFIFIFHLFYF